LPSRIIIIQSLPGMGFAESGHGYVRGINNH
jgi:hypothetical protein